MSNLSNALQQLRQEHKQALQQVTKLQLAITTIEDLVGRNTSAMTPNSNQPVHALSAASRKRMARAQRARWAKARQESKPATEKEISNTSVKRTMSAAARRKIAAAQRARWAKLKKAA